MQLTSRWLLTAGMVMVCGAMFFAAEVVVAQSYQQVEIATAPSPPIVLDLADGGSQPDVNAGLSVVSSEVDDSVVSGGGTSGEGEKPSADVISATPESQPAAEAVTTRGDDKRPAKKTVAARLAKTSTKSKSRKKKQGWVAPLSVLSQLEHLAEIPATKYWAEDTQRLIELLLEEKTVSSSGSAAVLMQLETKVQELDQLVANIRQQFVAMPVADALSSRLSRLRYDLAKRTTIWRTIQKLPEADSQANFVKLASNERLSLDYFNSDWQDYLQVKQLEDAFEALKPNAAAQKKAARITLARMASPSLSDAQQRYLNQVTPASMVTMLKQSAAGEVNQYKLLKAIEWNEQNPSGVATNYINDQFQNLMWSPEPDRQAAAGQLQAHYRNANVRLAVSQNMLNRLIPDSPAVNEPVREQVLGADVRGVSQVRNRLSVKLVNDPSRIALKLQTLGEVDSDTVAKRSGFEIRNEGVAKFQAFKKLTLDRMGRFSSDKPVASAQARQRLIGVRSRLDSFPIVNWIARRVAEKKVAQQTPEATMLLEQKIEKSAIHQLQEGVESQVAQMQAYLKVNLLEPLISMDLNPEALQLATTNERIVMRYRLAGIDQMAADSPRPADSEYDYLSLQFHQSLLNNAIERIEIESQTFTPESLLQHLAEVIGFNPENTKSESKHEAKFVFANYDAIRVDFVEGKVRVELNLKSLRIGKGKTWRNITISSTYVPKVVGSQVQLTQQGIIGVKGKKFRIGDQIAVRAIFKLVLPDSYQFDTIPPQLASRLNGYALVISTLNLADGWAGVTYDEVPIGYPEYLQETPVYESSGPIYQAQGQNVIISDVPYQR